jgi:hypothetical protein
MRRLLYLAVVTATLLSSQGTEVITARRRKAPAATSITRAHTVFQADTTQYNCSPTCSITVPSTTSGNLLVFTSVNADSATALLTPSGGGTWVTCSYATTTPIPETVAIYYVLSATGGTTSISLSASYEDYYGIAYTEYAGGTFTLDGACQHTSGGATATPLSPSLTTAGAKDVLVTVLGSVYIDYGAPATTVSGAGWTSPLQTYLWLNKFAPGNAVGIFDDGLNVAAGTYQATFNASPEPYLSIGAAFTN